MSTTCSCGKPTSGGAWCSRCRHTVDVAIAHVAAYHDDLDTVRNRQTSYGGIATMGSVGKSQPLVVDASFLPGGRGTRAQAAARNAVTTWARALHDDLPGVGWPKYDTVHSVCNFFAANLTAIAAMPWADEFKADMLACEHALSLVVDRPPDSWYAGECGFVMQHDVGNCACACHHAEGASCDIEGGCGLGNAVCTKVLYAEPGNPFVRCGQCGTTWETDQRREWLLTEAEDREATIETIVKIATTLGERDVSTAQMSARIRQWAVRGKITSHGERVVDGRPRPLYRVGDVLDLLEA